MATRKVEEKIEPSSRSDSRRRRDRGDTGFLVYTEWSVTINIDPTTNTFMKLTAGHERLSPSDNERDLMKTFEASRQFNEKILDKHARRAKKLIRQIEAARDE